MNNNYSGIEYDAVRKQIEDLRSMENSWEQIRNGSFFEGLGIDFENWNIFQSHMVKGWKSVTFEEWKELVDEAEEAEKQSIYFSRRSENSTLASDNEINDARVSTSKGSSWQIYRGTLKDKGFSENSINRIERQTVSILRHLSIDTAETGPQKGLVIGNVQSGKTASMAGLMAMAADNGWNYFIVLTGLTENLRKQTEIRLRADLGKGYGSLTWDYIKYSDMEDRYFEYESFSNNRRVFFSVCLKNKSRLTTLLKFLGRDPHPEKLRILIIDDEADQGSVNTGDVNDEKKRKAINKLILRLVYGEVGKDRKSEDFGALNYVSYTATPYANCLNEFKSEDEKKTLYPENFISRISAGEGYFGPDVIFGVKGAGPDEHLDIINFIPREQTKDVQNIENEKSSQLPETMKDSILWFICAAAVQRYRKIAAPVSMMIHTNFKVTAQNALYEAVRSWLISIRQDVLQLAGTVYAQQTEKFTLKDLETVCPEYENLKDVKNYPAYSDLEPFITELISDITAIHLDREEGQFTYNKGLLLCEDNSATGVDEEGNQLRLIYPDREQLKKMGYAPAFIVIGGNTLSRGLTLEGLVSSYFLRGSIQADSLMQMGRWFGYRKGYELLPRIWMTEETFEKFQYLVEIDEDLRDQIDMLSRLGKKPTDFQLSLLTSPRANWLRLTAKNKMQRAVTVPLDYAGTDMQMTTYLKDSQIIHQNNRILTDFMHSLGKPQLSEMDTHSIIWRGVPFRTINNEIFHSGFRVADTSRSFQNMDSLHEWIEKETKKGNFKNWTVILAGTRPDQENPDRNYSLNEEFSIGKVNRQGTESGEDRISIKVLTNKKDYTAHLRKSDFDDPAIWHDMSKEKRMSLNYLRYINAAHAQQIPLLLIYCVDRNSAPRRKKEEAGTEYRKSLAEMGIQEDFLGLAIVIPGERGTHTVKMKIDSSFYSTEGDDDFED